MRTYDANTATQTDRHDTLMVGKQRERAIKRNNLAVAQQYPVMLVLNMPNIVHPYMCQSPRFAAVVNCQCEWPETNDYTSFYCVMLELTGK